MLPRHLSPVRPPRPPTCVLRGRHRHPGGQGLRPERPSAVPCPRTASHQSSQLETRASVDSLSIPSRSLRKPHRLRDAGHRLAAAPNLPQGDAQEDSSEHPERVLPPRLGQALAAAPSLPAPCGLLVKYRFRFCIPSTLLLQSPSWLWQVTPSRVIKGDVLCWCCDVISCCQAFKSPTSRPGRGGRSVEQPRGAGASFPLTCLCTVVSFLHYPEHPRPGLSLSEPAVCEVSAHTGPGAGAQHGPGALCPGQAGSSSVPSTLGCWCCEFTHLLSACGCVTVACSPPGGGG